MCIKIIASSHYLHILSVSYWIFLICDWLFRMSFSLAANHYRKTVLQNPEVMVNWRNRVIAQSHSALSCKFHKHLLIPSTLNRYQILSKMKWDVAVEFHWYIFQLFFRYCECFANGQFCDECNCTNCYNNLKHEVDRSKAIRQCLERNPAAFRWNTIHISVQLFVLKR